MENSFEQIGARLTAAREAAGMDLVEAASQAKVPKAAAEALEAEDFSYFSSPVYAKSFLTQYSEFLGVDAHTWLEALEPGSFMAGGGVVKGTEGVSHTREQEESEQRGGVMSVFLLLLISTAIVMAAIKGCEFFESSLEGANEEPPVVPAAVLEYSSDSE